MMTRRQVFAALAAMFPDEHAPAANEEKPDVEELVKMWADALRHLRLASPPIGSVQAFAGTWLPRKTDGAWTELEIGWLLCDGRKLDDVQTKLHEELKKQKEKIPEDGILAELRAVLPPFKNGPAEALPNYCGMFLRGVDCGTNGKTTGNDKDGIRPVGQLQGFATAIPQGKDKAFKAKPNGKHSHAHLLEMTATRNPGDRGQSANTVAQPQVGPDRNTAEDGEHPHVIEGGDDETRPINIAVYYIIKFQ